MENVKGYCTVCDGERIAQNSVWPVGPYQKGKFFCSDECLNVILDCKPESFSPFRVLMVSERNSFVLHYDNGVAKGSNSNNYKISPDDIVYVFAENEEDAVNSVKWIYPHYTFYVVMR